MNEVQKDQPTVEDELPNSWWRKVYAAVILTTIVVILALWAFSRYFS